MDSVQKWRGERGRCDDANATDMQTEIYNRA